MKTSLKTRSLTLVAVLAFAIGGCGDRTAQTDAPVETPEPATDVSPSIQESDSSTDAPESTIAAENAPEVSAAESSVSDNGVPEDRALPDPSPVAGDATTMPETNVSDDGDPSLVGKSELAMSRSEDSDAATAAADDEAWKDDEPTAEDLARKAFLPPPDSKSLSEKGRLWIDLKQKRVYIDGYVALKSGPLEMFACPAGTKEHESIVAAIARSREVHAALLAIGATPGTPVKFRPEFSPPTGQVIRVWVCWYDDKGQFQFVDAREWIGDLETEKAMEAEWVFAGSGFWEDPEDKREYYLADSGDMICVSNFSSAMLDVAIPSSADTGELRFVPYETKIPEPDTPVRLVLTPVPMDSDAGDAGAAQEDLVVPTAGDLPRAGSSN